MWRCVLSSSSKGDRYSFSEGLVSGLVGLCAMTALAFLVSLLSPGQVKGWGFLLPFVKRDFFPKALAVALSIGGVQIGGAERRWAIPGGSRAFRALRILGLAMLYVSAFAPFLFASAAEDAVGIGSSFLTLAYLLLLTVGFAGLGYGLEGMAGSEGTGIVLRYGAMAAVYVGTAYLLPWLSPLEAVTYPWLKGVPGLGFWALLGLDSLIVGWWLRGFSAAGSKR